MDLAAGARLRSAGELADEDESRASAWFLFKLALATLAATLVLISLGGTVRATGSGLACPDWPLCQGKVVPPAQKGTVLEVSHRLAATVVGLLTLATFLTVVRNHRSSRAMLVAAFLSGVLVVGQVILGAAVILAKLPPALVTVHLAMATGFAGAIAAIAIAALVRARPRAWAVEASRGSVRWVLAATAATYLLIVLGGHVSSSGSSLACTQWPLCNGLWIPNGDWRVWLGFSHRIVAAVMVVLVVGSALSVFLRKEPAALRRIVAGALAVTAAEALVGALNPILLIPAAVVVAHLSLATLAWMLLAGASALCLTGWQHPARQTAES